MLLKQTNNTRQKSFTPMWMAKVLSPSPPPPPPPCAHGFFKGIPKYLTFVLGRSRSLGACNYPHVPVTAFSQTYLF